jgi:hypothetical protein
MNMLTDALYEAVLQQVTGHLVLPAAEMARIIVSEDQRNNIETIQFKYLKSPWYYGGSNQRPQKLNIKPFTAIKISVQLTEILKTFRCKIFSRNNKDTYKKQLYKNVVVKLFISISHIAGVEGGVAVIFYQDIFILLLLIEYLFS